MALDPLQRIIAGTALTLPEARTLALAGGGVMIVHGYPTAPPTTSIYSFADSVSAIRRLTNADWTEDGVELESVSALAQLFEHWNTEIRSIAQPQSRVTASTNGEASVPSDSQTRRS